MTNLEHYEKELKENGRDEYPCTMFTIREDLSDEEDEQEICDHKCQECFIKSIKWFNQEYHEPVLTDEEKACLKKIIKPKRDSVIYIRKTAFLKGTENEFTNIVIATKDTLEAVVTPGMSFEGMKLEREYSLEELGL